MEDLMGILLGLGGLILGVIIMFLIGRKSNNSKIADVNKKADLTLKEAEITAKRKLDDAETRAEKNSF